MAKQTDSAHDRVFALKSSRELPPAAVMRLLSRYERSELASFIAVAIELLDIADGDPDIEGECSEDEISRCTDWGRPVRPDGPGCIIGDPDKGVDDDGEGIDEREADYSEAESGLPITGGGSGDY